MRGVASEPCDRWRFFLLRFDRDDPMRAEPIAHHAKSGREERRAKRGKNLAVFCQSRKQIGPVVNGGHAIHHTDRLLTIPDAGRKVAGHQHRFANAELRMDDPV